jgi:hypothetical protein
MFRLAISLGGDTDTIASMAGAITGAYLGIQVSAHLLFILFTVNIVPDYRQMGKICVMMLMNVADPRFIHGDHDPVLIKCPTHVLGYVWKICVGFSLVGRIRIRVDKNSPQKKKSIRIRITSFSGCSLSLYRY